MDNTVKPKLSRDFELLFKHLGLLASVTFTIRRVSPRLLAGKTMIIEAGFPDRDDFGMPRQLAQGRPQISGRFQRMGGMPADGCETAAS